MIHIRQPQQYTQDNYKKTLKTTTKIDTRQLNNDGDNIKCDVDSHENLKLHVTIEAAIFTLLLLRRVAFPHRTATCRPLFKPSVSLLSTYKTIEMWFEFLSHF